MEQQLITKVTLVARINDCLAHQITIAELSQWAEFLEGNEAVRYEEHAEKTIADVLFWLSSPEINEELNDATLHKYLEYLK